jgi:MFS family permease
MSKTSTLDRDTLSAMPLLVTLLAGQAMASKDGEILVIAAPSLRANLHASGAQLQLILGMYTLAFGALVVTGARLGDVLGHRRIFLLGLTAFTLASVAGGLAPTASVLIGAVALQGMGAGLMTPQVLSIIQLHFAGERRARAIGAYSMVLAAGVATGMVLGGLLVTAHLLAAAWRPALLLNAPVGAVVLLSACRHLPESAGGAHGRLDPAGAATLAAALLALIVPLTFGRDAGWPIWVWPSLAASAVALAGFVRLEQHIAARGGDPLFDLDVLMLPGVAAGIGAVALVMACYAGFLVSLTLHLQESLGFSPLAAGLIFAAYASGFATASLTWTRASATVRDRLPIAGPRGDGDGASCRRRDRAGRRLVGGTHDSIAPLRGCRARVRIQPAHGPPHHGGSNRASRRSERVGIDGEPRRPGRRRGRVRRRLSQRRHARLCALTRPHDRGPGRCAGSACRLRVLC